MELNTCKNNNKWKKKEWREGKKENGKGEGEEKGEWEGKVKGKERKREKEKDGKREKERKHTQSVLKKKMNNNNKFPCKARNLQTSHGEEKLQAIHIASFVDMINLISV